jgi:hypothetical protein
LMHGVTMKVIFMHLGKISKLEMIITWAVLTTVRWNVTKYLYKMFVITWVL